MFSFFNHTKRLPIFLLVLTASGLQAQIPPEINAVTPVEIDSVLLNPGIGFNTFQHFNGDSVFPGSGWTEGFPIIYETYKDGQNRNYPQTTTAYWRDRKSVV